jgi:hypothetical protein
MPAAVTGVPDAYCQTADAREGDKWPFYDGFASLVRKVVWPCEPIVLINGPLAELFWFGLRRAIWQDVISNSSFSGFGWLSASSSASLSTSLLNGAASAGAALATSDPAATEGSFQNIFAQAVAPEPVTPDSSGSSAAPAPVAQCPSTNAVANTQDEAAFTAAPASLPERRDKTASAASPGSERASGKSGARTLPQRTEAAKQEYVNHAARPAEASRTGGTAAEAAGNQTVASQSEAAPSAALDSASSKKSVPAAGSGQNGLPAAATTALGGSKNLSGAAFAMHITPAGSQSNASANSAESSGATTDPAISAGNIADPLPSGSSILAVSGAHAQPLIETSNGAGVPAAPLVSWASAGPAASLNDQVGSAEAATTAGAGEIEAEDPSDGTQPVRTVQVQLAGEGEGRVDLRLVEHAGGLSVSVRASDSALTRGLQDNLPELSARLAAEKYDTHTFLPSANEASGGGSSSGSSERQSGQAHEQSGGQSFSQGGSASGGDGSGRQPDQAAWWRQMAALGRLSSAVATSVQGSPPDLAANPLASAQGTNPV